MARNSQIFPSSAGWSRRLSRRDGSGMSGWNWAGAAWPDRPNSAVQFTSTGSRLGHAATGLSAREVDHDRDGPPVLSIGSFLRPERLGPLLAVGNGVDARRRK